MLPWTTMYVFFHLCTPGSSETYSAHNIYGTSANIVLIRFTCSESWAKAWPRNANAGTGVPAGLSGQNWQDTICPVKSSTHVAGELQWHLPKMQPNKACHSCRIKPPLITAPSHPCSRQAWKIASATKQPKAFSLLRSSWVRVDKADPSVHNTSWRVEDSALVSTLVYISLAFIQHSSFLSE